MQSTTGFVLAVPGLNGPGRQRGLVLALAASVAVGLLFVFIQLLRGAVAQGELRVRQEAALASATWRCKALQGVAARAACLAALPVQRRAP